MLEIHKHFKLRDYNTFGMDVLADEFIIAHSEAEIVDFLKNKSNQSPLLILGGGSNILFGSDFHGTILKPNMMGIEVLKETNDYVIVESGAGVEWDDLVAFTVAQNWCGLENLSLIPGNVGACPIQNIGAYGVEVKDAIENVEGLYFKDGSKFSFSNAQCEFDYRFSIFKSSLKSQCVITKVQFRLSKRPNFILNYGNLDDELHKLGTVSLSNVRQAVINIRNSKLPDPKQIGNAGSFFKNPFISIEKAAELKEVLTGLPLFSAGEHLLKTSAAFLIDKAGWKGFREGDAGVHDKQALVLVNYGQAKGHEIIALAKKIQSDVEQKFGIELEMEVNFV